MKRLKLTDKVGLRGDITILEILKLLSHNFPDGFSSNQATALFNREYSNLYLCFGSSLSKDLLYSDYVSREDNPSPGPRYIYNINLDGSPITEIDKEKVNIEKIINSYNQILTPRLGEGSLKEELLNDLKLVFKDL
jgi:hypothetical protein